MFRLLINFEQEIFNSRQYLLISVPWRVFSKNFSPWNCLNIIEYFCRRLPPVTACSTPLISKDKTRAHRDMLCHYSKIKLTKLPLNNYLDKLLHPPPLIFIKYGIHLYINIYTYTILRLFIYLCAKSIKIAKKLVSWENGYTQMHIVLNSFAVLYLNLIGQNKYSCQNFDQTTALLECGQNLVTRT